MDDQCVDYVRNVEITAEHAVLIPALPTVKNLMAYVEAVAVVIGSCHIHSVYESDDNVKVYLNDKRFVDILVNNGVSILGRQMNVEYAAPRADKLILSNVDPIVPDAALMKLLSFYGQPVSAIIHEKVATNCEYSHIECGNRRVYMKMFADKEIPANISFTFQENLYRMDIVVDKCDKNAPCEPAPTLRVEEMINDEQLEVGSNQSLKPNIQELMALNPRQPTPKQLAYRNRGNKESSPDSATNAARKIKRRARGAGWFGSRLTRMRRNLDAVKANPGGRGKRLVVKKVAVAKKGMKKSGDFPKQRGRPASNRSISAQEINPEPFDVIEINSNEAAMDQTSSSVTEQTDMQSISQYPLSVEELQKFVFKTRFQRDPMQVAVEFLADNNTPDAIAALLGQLQEYGNVCKEPSLRIRIRRLIVSLKNANEVVE